MDDYSREMESDEFVQAINRMVVENVGNKQDNPINDEGRQEQEISKHLKFMIASNQNKI